MSQRGRAALLAVTSEWAYVPAVDYRTELQAALGNDFAIERELAGAGASQVFVAEELSLGRRVVVKMLPRQYANAVNAERFRREIAVAARLQHPHLVPLLTAGVVGSAGVPWFSMPFVDGESLRELIVRRGPLPIVMAVRLMREMASALAYAHARGVVHRDIKPENVLLSDGVAMITDFGVAMAVEGAGIKGKRLTGAGVSLGTPAYTAPEQVESAGTVDHRADIYSFGCVAYELLTGSAPFTGSLRELLQAHLHELPEPLERTRSALPPALTAIVMRCLEKDPAKRPESAAEIVRVLDGISLASLSETGEMAAVTAERIAVPSGASARVVAPSAAPSTSRVTSGLLLAVLTVVLAAAAAVLTR